MAAMFLCAYFQLTTHSAHSHTHTALSSILSAEDVMLSYLPLAHIFDRSSEELFLAIGGRIGYWQGKLDSLVDDIGALKPTLFIGVPRVFDKIYNAINDTIAGSGCLSKFIFNWAYSAKLARLQAHFPSAGAAPFWDKLVFSKVPFCRSSMPLCACVRATRCAVHVTRTACLLSRPFPAHAPLTPQATNSPTPHCR
jgi:hypothetical protein